MMLMQHIELYVCVCPEKSGPTMADLLMHHLGMVYNTMIYLLQT